MNDYWSCLKKGDASQFSDNAGKIRACIIRHVYADGSGFKIDYYRDGEVIKGAMIHGSDIVRDEDIATKGTP